MPVMLGLDTGGTFTDAALVDTTSNTVVGKAKSLTTRTDLALGVGDAMQKALDVYSGAAQDISLVCLSTTLATNAVVEGVGGRVGLILIGFDDEILTRGVLRVYPARNICIRWLINGIKTATRIKALIRMIHF